MKFYEYVDESGRDPFASFFIVGIVLTDQRRQELFRRLLQIEQESGKGIRKWKKSNNKRRQQYVELISREVLFKSSLFYVKYGQGEDYFACTANAIVRTLPGKQKNDQVTVFIDGFRKAELNKIKKQLRSSGQIKIVVKTITREESNPIIRLSDAICGLVRDADEGINWAKKATTSLKNKGFLQEK